VIGWSSPAGDLDRAGSCCARAVRARVAPTVAVGVRLSLEDFGQARGQDLDDNLQVAQWLAEDGVDFIHASQWDVTKMSTKRPDEHPLTLLRAALPREVAILTAGKIWTREDGEAALARCGCHRPRALRHPQPGLAARSGDHAAADHEGRARRACRLTALRELPDEVEELRRRLAPTSA